MLDLSTFQLKRVEQVLILRSWFYPGVKHFSIELLPIYVVFDWSWNLPIRGWLVKLLWKLLIYVVFEWLKVTDPCGSWSGSEIYRSGWVLNGLAPSDLYFAPSDPQSKFMTLGWPSDFQIYDPNPATLLGGSCCKHVRCNQLTIIWILKDRKFIGDFIRLTIQGPKVLIIMNFITNFCSKHMNYFSALAAPTSTMPTTFGATLTRFLHALILIFIQHLGFSRALAPMAPWSWMALAGDSTAWKCSLLCKHWNLLRSTRSKIIPCSKLTGTHLTLRPRLL